MKAIIAEERPPCHFLLANFIPTYVRDLPSPAVKIPFTDCTRLDVLTMETSTLWTFWADVGDHTIFSAPFRTSCRTREGSAEK